MGVPALQLYTLITNVALLNLLIAMFTETYARIKSNAEVEYGYNRYLRIFELQNVVTAVPPPFNLPIIMWSVHLR